MKLTRRSRPHPPRPRARPSGILSSFSRAHKCAVAYAMACLSLSTPLCVLSRTPREDSSSSLRPSHSPAATPAGARLQRCAPALLSRRRGVVSLRPARIVSAASTASIPSLPEELPRALSQAVLQSFVACALLSPVSLLSSEGVLRPLACLLFGGAVASFGVHRNALSQSGATAAAAVGVATLLCGLPFTCCLLSFFLASSRLTAFGAARKALIEADYRPGGQRSAGQVAANAGLPTLLALSHAALRSFSAPPVATAPLAAAVLAYYACCCGDTWASELGVLSPKPPRLITNLGRVVAPGTNGGVTMAGTAASAAGGLFIGAMYACASFVSGGAELPAVYALLTGLFAGLFGSLADSLLGATVQYSGLDEDGRVHNKPMAGLKLRRIGGHDWLTNSAVNVISAAAISLAALAVTATLGIAAFPPVV